MTHATYFYKRQGFQRYIFTSVGKNRIIKLVDFSPTKTRDLYNVGFGDLLPDGTINDTINSNNGDMVKVLATLVQIIKDFTSQFPEIKLMFLGSTLARTKLYARIIKTYYDNFSKIFIITAFIKRDGSYKEVSFDPQVALIYYAFFIKRIV
jgi:hypothetical protein